MKHGNFVGQNWLPFNREELEAIMNHLSSQLIRTFGDGFFSHFSYSVSEKDSPVIMATVTAKLSEPFNGRNWFKSLIKDCKEIRFYITKDSGYLEIKDPKFPYDVTKYKKDWENAPEFSYGCSMNVSGRERRYRHKHWESIQNWSPYQYGSEVKDLTYTDDDLNNLRKAITSPKPGEQCYTRL